MDRIKYYSSHDKQFIIENPFNPCWRSVCHNQPIMDNSYPIFIDEELREAHGLCRRCGNYSELRNEGMFWYAFLGK